MSEPKDWALPPELRPDPANLAYDLGAALGALVLLRAEVPEDAFTAGVLGTERLGHGALIAVGGRTLVLTIGYLVTEASTIWLTSHSGRVVQGHALAYDYASGFGLVMPLGPLDGTPLALATQLPETGDELVAAGHGGIAHALACRLVARREFAGYWEYLLEEALFTAPPLPLWSGGALLGPDGTLVGIGSLLTRASTPGVDVPVGAAGDEPGGASQDVHANMFVPVTAIAPQQLRLLAETGSTGLPPRPWLGVYASEDDGDVEVAGLVARGPAHAAGVSLGDVIRAVGGLPVTSLPSFYRALWSQGEAGAGFTLQVERAGETLDLRVKSAARESFLKQPQRH
jgi:S1-C subfamily serine protease